MSRRVAVLIRDRERQYEGLRYSLGLLLEQHVVGMFVLDQEIAFSEAYEDNMAFIDEMGGARYSNVRANVARHGFQPVSLEEVARQLRDYDLIVPF